MSKYGSSSVFLYVDGYNLSPVVGDSLPRKVEVLTQETRPFGGETDVNTPTGICKYILTADGGFYDDGVDLLHNVVGAGVGTSRIVCTGNEGDAIGQHFVGYAGVYSQAYEPIAAAGALHKANVTYQVSGAADAGAIVQHRTAKTADWNTDTLNTVVDYADDPANRSIPITSSSVANPSLIITTVPHGWANGDIVAIFDHVSVAPDINDNPTAAEAWKLIGHTITVTGADRFTIPVNVTDGGTGGYAVRVATTTGAVGYQQVTALAGFTGFVGKFQHSADNVTYADLSPSFTNVTAAPGKERIVITGTINRYIAYDGNVTGTGSITVFAGLART